MGQALNTKYRADPDLPTQDGAGNVAGLYDMFTGAKWREYEYDGFGRMVAERKWGGPSHLDVMPFRYSTRMLDPETGLQAYHYRLYSPQMGRWLSRDPIGEAGGLNLYGMVGNNPVNYVDPLGLAESTAAGAIVTRLGHHRIPVELWDDYFTDKAAQQHFDLDRIPIEVAEDPHNFRGHGRTNGYTEQVEAELQEFLKKKGITCAEDCKKVSPELQRAISKEFAEKIRYTDNDFIRLFNENVRGGGKAIDTFMVRQGDELLKTKGRSKLFEIGKAKAKKLPGLDKILIAAAISADYQDARDLGCSKATDAFVSGLETVNPLPFSGADQQKFIKNANAEAVEKYQLKGKTKLMDRYKGVDYEILQTIMQE